MRRFPFSGRRGGDDGNDVFGLVEFGDIEDKLELAVVCVRHGEAGQFGRNQDLKLEIC